MAMEAIAAVEDAERAAQQKKAEAAQQAKQLAAAAEEQGREAVTAARRAAEEALLGVEKQADERIAAESAAIREETQRSLNELRAQAAARLDDAAKIIVERIVNG